MVTEFTLYGIAAGLVFSILAMMSYFREMREKLEAIVESQRLSTILRIEPASLKVDPTKFEPNRERLKTLLLQELNNPRNMRDRDPDTSAFCILHHTGFAEFVDHETKNRIQNALARLFTNGEMEEARRFLTEVVDKL